MNQAIKLWFEGKFRQARQTYYSEVVRNATRERGDPHMYHWTFFCQEKYFPAQDSKMVERWIAWLPKRTLTPTDMLEFSFLIILITTSVKEEYWLLKDFPEVEIPDPDLLSDYLKDTSKVDRIMSYWAYYFYYLMIIRILHYDRNWKETLKFFSDLGSSEQLIKIENKLSKILTTQYYSCYAYTERIGSIFTWLYLLLLELPNFPLNYQVSKLLFQSGDWKKRFIESFSVPAFPFNLYVGISGSEWLNWCDRFNRGCRPTVHYYSRSRELELYRHLLDCCEHPVTKVEANKMIGQIPWEKDSFYLNLIKVRIERENYDDTGIPQKYKVISMILKLLNWSHNLFGCDTLVGTIFNIVSQELYFQTLKSRRFCYDSMKNLLVDN